MTQIEKEQAGPSSYGKPSEDRSSLKLLPSAAFGTGRMTARGGVGEEQQRGVTLLELLVVVALASVLLAVVFPSVGAGLRTLELRSAAQRLAASARYARDQAVHRQRFYELEIDAEAGTVTVMDYAGESRRSFALPASVHVERILPQEGVGRMGVESRRRFVFSPDGNAPAFEIVLGNDRRQAAVRSNPLTGFPKVEEM